MKNAMKIDFTKLPQKEKTKTIQARLPQWKHDEASKKLAKKGLKWQTFLDQIVTQFIDS